MEDLARLCDNLLVLNSGEKVMYGSVANVFSRYDELKSIGLDIPAVTRVLLQLKEMGFDVDTNAYTIEQVTKNILASARKGDAKC